jgi:hypothetical protein
LRPNLREILKNTLSLEKKPWKKYLHF